VSSSFRELEVWRRSMAIAESVYRLSGAFPKTEMYGLTGQLRRAAVSVPSNIAEGHARASTREYLQYVSVAEGPLAELETQLELAVRLDYISEQELGPIREQCVCLGKQLYQLRQALVQRLRAANRSPIPEPRLDS